MNILILSCGTRNKLIQYFKDERNGIDKVIATDCSRYAPALYEADVNYIVPKMTDEHYLDIILDICNKESVNIILPLQEDELLLMAKNKNMFLEKGILVMVSDYETVILCRDKFSLYTYMCSCNIKTIDTILGEEVKNASVNFPVFVKHRYGAGSVDSMKIETKELLHALIKEKEEEFVIQPYIAAKEYGVDAYIDYISGELVAVFIKEKLRMRAGETEKSISVKDTTINKLVKKITECINLKGPVDIDILKKGNEYFVLEINPRFGGGYSHAYECGVNFPEFIKNNAEGKIIKEQSGEYDTGVVALKYSEIVIRND